MTPMLEKIARAIYDAAPFRSAEGAWEDQTDEYRRLCAVYARAALLAMREPDDFVCEAGNDADYGCTEGIGLDRLLQGHDYGPWQDGLRLVFNAMIDAILKESGE